MKPPWLIRMLHDVFDRRLRTFRRGVLRGLTFLLPPILTIVILVWVINTVDAYVLQPLTVAVRDAVVWGISDVRAEPPRANADRQYSRLESGEYIPSEVIDWLRQNAPPVPATSGEAYRRYVDGRYLQPRVVVPVFLCVFVLLLYVLGKFMAGKISGMFDWGILRLPLVRKVYSSVKQVTSFVFGENQIVEYRRVVAIEYPRPGLWSIGLVMGEAVQDVSAAANEPCVTVMLPTSPALFTVKPVMLPKSKTHDLNMTIDQALQFIISCGVVAPAHQLPGGVAQVDEPMVIPRRRGEASHG